MRRHEQRGVRRKLHQTVRKVGAQIETFQFNTAVAAIMELLNEIYAYAPLGAGSAGARELDPAVVSELAETLTLLLAPFAPHLGEEIWQQLGGDGTVYRAPWPGVRPGGGRRRRGQRHDPGQRQDQGQGRASPWTATRKR